MEDTSHACTLMSTPVPKDALMRTGLYFKLYTAHRTLKSVFRQTRDAAQLVDCLLACTKPWIAVPIPEKPVCAYSPSTLKGRGRRVRNPRPFLASFSATQHVKKPTWNM